MSPYACLTVSALAFLGFGSVPESLRLQANMTVGLASHAILFTQSEPKPDSASEDKSTAKFPNAETERLEIYVGPWSVTERHFNERGEEIATVKGSEDIVWVLDHHAIARTYTTTHGQTLYRATSTLKWIPADALYRGVWFDSDPESRPTSVSGEWNDKEKTMMWKMEVVARDGAKQNFKIVEKFLDAERREATTYLVDGANVSKKLVVQYKRTVPCPGRIRSFFGS